MEFEDGFYDEATSYMIIDMSQELFITKFLDLQLSCDVNTKIGALVHLLTSKVL